MTLKLVHSMARNLRAKTRRQLMGTLAGPLFTAVSCAFGLAQFPALRAVLQPLFLGALVWSLAGVYFLNRGMWATEMPGDAGLSSGLEFCRQELGRRRRLLRGVLLWSFAPVLMTIGTLILALARAGAGNRRLLPNGLPFLVVVAIWIASYFVMRWREQRELGREIAELDEIARG